MAERATELDFEKESESRIDAACDRLGAAGLIFKVATGPTGDIGMIVLLPDYLDPVFLPIYEENGELKEGCELYIDLEDLYLGVSCNVALLEAIADVLAPRVNASTLHGYVTKLQRQLISRYGFREDPSNPGLPLDVRDGVFPMIINGKPDRVRIAGGIISCSNFDSLKD